MGRERERPHPATYILFPPPATPRADELFETELETSAPRTLNYKMSCPALLGTASRRLERINEDNCGSPESSTSDRSTSPDVPCETMPAVLDTVARSLNKKRSFLLVDVLDSVEGRPEPKRQHVLDSSSILSTESIEVQGQPRTRSLRRQRTDFEMFYASSKSRALQTGREPLSPIAVRFDHPQDNVNFTRQNPGMREDASSRGRQPALRNKKSLLAISIERTRSTSPSRKRLDDIDMDDITSFDAILGGAMAYKADAPQVKVEKKISVGHNFDAAASLTDEGHTEDAAVSTRMDFSRNTARLMQLPVEKPRRKTVRTVRHAKSARDILQEFSTNKTRPVLVEGAASITQDRACQDGDVISRQRVGTTQCDKKERTLREGLNRLLGLRKKKI